MEDIKSIIGLVVAIVLSVVFLAGLTKLFISIVRD